MDVIETIFSRRSMRSYKPTPVPKSIVDKLLQCAVMAPSAMNKQPWRFVVITNKAKIKELSEKAKANLHFLGKGMKFAELATRKEDLIFYGAPLLIMICTSPADEWAKADVGLAAENMFLAARSLGLGSCYVGLANSLNNDKKLLASLGIPEDHEIIASLIFGYPKGDFPAAPKREAKILKRFD